MAIYNTFKSLQPNLKESYSKDLQDANLPKMLDGGPAKIKQIQPQNLLTHRFNLLKRFLKPVQY